MTLDASIQEFLVAIPVIDGAKQMNLRTRQEQNEATSPAFVAGKRLTPEMRQGVES
jgi:hypothetical protein